MSEMLVCKPSLMDRVNARLTEMGRTKAELSAECGMSRSTVSNYLNGKMDGIATKTRKNLEEWLEIWMKDNGEATCYINTQAWESIASQDITEQYADLRKHENFETTDFNGVTGLCTLCQETHDLGIVVGRSGYGKTYTLKNYARLPKVIHIECNETMNCKDIIRRIEQAVGLPKGSGSIDERLNRICSFFNTNRGYLLIVDEADKLLSKYTIKKIELIRNIADSAADSLGIVLAGEPSLEASMKAYDERFANRMGLIYKLGGLTRKEVDRYFKGYDIDDDALEELYARACNKNTGCFRLLDRTLNNVIRILKNSDTKRVTYKVIQEASSMMIL